MSHVPWHVKGTRAAPRDAAADAARRSGISVPAAFAMIRKELHELRRQTSRPQVEPAAFEQQLSELASQIGALQGMAGGSAGPGPAHDAFLGQLKTLLAQNLTALQQQVATTAADAISGPAESIRRDVASLKEIQASVDRRTQDTFEAVYGTIERIVDRLAAIEDELRERTSGAPADDPPPFDETPSTGGADGLGVPAVQPPADPQAPRQGLPNLAPADAAGQSVMLRQPATLPDAAVGTGRRQESVAPAPDRRASPTRSGRLVVAAHRVLTGVTAPAASSGVPASMTAALAARLRGLLTGALRQHRKTTVLGLGAALLVLFAVSLALDFYRAPAESSADPIHVAATGPDPGQPDGARAHAAQPSPDLPPVPQDSGKDKGEPGQESNRESSQNAGNDDPVGAPPTAEPATTAAAPLRADAAPWDADTLMRNVLLPTPPARAPWPQAQSDPPPGSELAAAPLPPAIGKELAAAAQAGDPAAGYEIAIRFMQGRNAAADAAKAAAWLERSAQAGFPPAQFRLGSMYEKGHGVRKNVAEARRLYQAAAAKGHAKAMHSLAVLYTRGIDGAPDYGAAVEWFRKAASYGMVDSQYNLGILYARGAGVKRDLKESYKWFALAARGGDKDAARRRDEVAKGLDPRQLESAKASAEAFVATPQPEEARTPAGGWDQAAATATTKSRTESRTVARSERFPGK